MNKYTKWAITIVAVIAILVVSYFASGTNVNKIEDTDTPISSASVKTEQPASEQAKNEDTTEEGSSKSSTDPKDDSAKGSKGEGNKANEETTNKAEAKDENNGIAKEPPSHVSTDEKVSENTKGQMYCTLSVKCHTVLNNMRLLTPEKHGIVPQNGIIYPEQKVMFNEGESVFNVLLREMKKNKIHFEFTNSPIYKSAYIEGLGNLYEFDCGELSGWMYRVNGWFPNYGCSRYILKDGDVIELIYSCDFGDDIGGRNVYTEEE